MDINRSRRILALGKPGSGVLKLIEDLTGSAPLCHDNGSTAGLTHEWEVKTAYYEAKVPIWIDEITDVQEWKTEFSKPEAREVVEAVGAWVYCFKPPTNQEVSQECEEVMKAIQEVSEEHAGYGADTVMLAAAMPAANGTALTAEQDEWDDTCMQYGFEFINYGAKGKNEFGENVGLDRLREALEANEWAATAGSDDGELDLDALGLDDGDEDDFRGFARDEAEMTAELFGMKSALAGHDFEPDAEDFAPPTQQAEDVETLDRLMGKLLAVKEQSADLPEAQRKRMAAKAVRELLSEGEGT
ncbi:uncharacterized protein LTR77_007357 [Saxophila tyrrhenica]|uniref:Uncharacterized protein n=1 Tax=Saxophila tyrrhenica TaxID=1690608 RepID=A0AAV9P568_9PEZI|nr:hypothetical protein LTR77_007357 [Saxophila tyrrhenica]